VFTPFGGNDDSGNSVVVQRDGKILETKRLRRLFPRHRGGD